MGKSSIAGTNNIVTGFSIFATLAYKDEPRLYLKKFKFLLCLLNRKQRRVIFFVKMAKAFEKSSSIRCLIL
jgi:hypothetical protein